MAKRILIAVDGSECAFNAVKYAAALCSGLNAQVTLLNVLPMGREEVYWKISMDDDFISRMMEKYELFRIECNRAGSQALEQARQVLMYAGLSPDVIGTTLQEWQSGIARDIIAESQNGYDAIVLGRRGMGKLESFLLGSVSNKIVQASQRVPIWVVSGKAIPRKMLMAVDGSNSSFKALEYAAPFAAQSGAEVTLCHVVRGFLPEFTTPLTLAGEEMQNRIDQEIMTEVGKVFCQCKKSLENAGVKLKMITTICRTESLSRSADILHIARDGGYGTIVMGKRGISYVREFIMGRVTTKVLNGAEGLTVWIVP